MTRFHRSGWGFASQGCVKRGADVRSAVLDSPHALHSANFARAVRTVSRGPARSFWPGTCGPAAGEGYRVEQPSEGSLPDTYARPTSLAGCPGTLRGGPEAGARRSGGPAGLGPGLRGRQLARPGVRAVEPLPGARGRADGRSPGVVHRWRYRPGLFTLPVLQRDGCARLLRGRPEPLSG